MCISRKSIEEANRHPVTFPKEAAKPTPGPWETLRLGKCLYVQPVGGGFVCDMSLHEAAPAARPTVCADAKLIAAAPDLLAACQVAAAWMRHASKECRQLEDAIAKATA